MLLSLTTLAATASLLLDAWGRAIAMETVGLLVGTTRLLTGTRTLTGSGGSLVDELTCLANALLPAIPDGRDAARSARVRAAEALDELGLADQYHAYPATISGDQRQHAVLAGGNQPDPGGPCR